MKRAVKRSRAVGILSVFLILSLLLAACGGAAPAAPAASEGGEAAAPAAAAGTFDEAALLAAAEKWVDSEFQPSTLSKEEQMQEMEWFIKAAAPYRGMEINVVSETITTHKYESEVLAKAFAEITGIKITHDRSRKAT